MGDGSNGFGSARPGSRVLGVVDDGVEVTIDVQTRAKVVGCSGCAGASGSGPAPMPIAG